MKDRIYVDGVRVYDNRVYFEEWLEMKGHKTPEGIVEDVRRNHPDLDPEGVVEDLYAEVSRWAEGEDLIPM